MTLKEISYMILESIRENELVDDENLDSRLIYDWIDLKRAQYIKNEASSDPNNRTNLNLYQKLSLTVEVVNPVTDAGDYPYADATTQLYKIVESTTEIPSIIEGKRGPMILTLESQDLMKLPFSVVDYDQMRFSGNGKFNSTIIFGSIRDNKVYFKYNTFFDTYTNVVLRAIFENPRDVDGFDPEEDEYPTNLGLLEYIKNAIFEKDIRMLFAGKADEQNDGDGTIRNTNI